MGMGYMGYAKLGNVFFLITSSSVNKVVTPIYSDSVRGAGWYNAGVSKYADDIVRYEGTLEYELQVSMWTILSNWIIESRNEPQTLILSPDGLDVQTFTSGTLTGAWNSSAGFSTSEGSCISGSAGVLAIAKSEILSGSYIANTVGGTGCLSSFLNPGNTNLNPVPFWKSTPSLLVSGSSPFDSDTDAVEWNVNVDQGLTVVYACVNAQGPIAVFTGEMDVTAAAVYYSSNGVAEVNGSTASNTSFSVSISGVGTINIGKVVLDQDSYNIGGGDNITNRALSMRGLAGDEPAIKLLNS